MNINDFCLENPKAPIGEQDILEFQIKHGIKSLPEDYVNYVLKKFNGGHPLLGRYLMPVNVFNIHCVLEPQKFRIAEFYTLDELLYPFILTAGGWLTEEEMHAKYQKYLFFGEAMNSLFLIGIYPDNFDQVYLWLTDEEEDFLPYKISNSFLEFIDLIEVEPREEY